MSCHLRISRPWTEEVQENAEPECVWGEAISNKNKARSLDAGHEEERGGTWIQVFSAAGDTIRQMLRGWRWSCKLGVIQLKVIVESTRGEKLTE